MAENLMFSLFLEFMEISPFLIEAKHVTKYLDKRVGHFKPVI